MFIYQKIRTLISDLQIEKKSIRIQDIADGIRISKKSLENYRDGASQPTVEVLERIAIYFGKDMNYFFDKPNNTVQITQIVASPVAIYDQPNEIGECYKVMFQQQKEITDKQKEITDLKIELERLKNISSNK